MRKIDLFTLNHYRPNLADGFPGGGIVTSFIMGEDDIHGDNISRLPHYGEIRAMYYVWKNMPDLDLVGFQGRRKLFDFRGDPSPGTPYGPPSWSVVQLPYFDKYQQWLRTWDGAGIEEIMATHDIIITEPFDVSYNVDMTEDFYRSASRRDWDAMMKVMSKYGTFNFHIPYITSHNMYVTTAAIFRRYMEFWWPIAQELDPLILSTDPGPRPDIYLTRVQAFLFERMFSIWLYSSGLKQKQVPLMICWEAP